DMRRPFTLLVAAAAAAGLFAAAFSLASSGGGSTRLAAKLSAATARPRPAGAAAAGGTFTATLTGSSLAWRLSFSKLTGRALAAHIHLGRPGTAGPVAVTLCRPCAPVVYGTERLAPKVRLALLSGGAYVDVHTAKNETGEIRGQVFARAMPPIATTQA